LLGKKFPGKVNLWLFTLDLRPQWNKTCFLSLNRRGSHLRWYFTGSSWLPGRWNSVLWFGVGCCCLSRSLRIESDCAPPTITLYKAKKAKAFQQALRNWPWPMGECIGASRSLKFTQPSLELPPIRFPTGQVRAFLIECQGGREIITRPIGYIFAFPCGKHLEYMRKSKKHLLLRTLQIFLVLLINADASVTVCCWTFLKLYNKCFFRHFHVSYFRISNAFQNGTQNCTLRFHNLGY